MDSEIIQLIHIHYPWFWPVVVAIFGAVIGSFLSCLTYRLPRGQSIHTANSHCTHCNRPLTAYDLIPIISWLLQRGRCRKCKLPIGRRYLVIECLTIAVSLAVFAAWGPTLCLLLPLIAAWVCLAFAIMWHEKRNP